MTSEQFSYWLRGFTELNGGTQPTAEQWKSINEHLQSVFVKTTPAVLQPGTIRSSEFRYEDLLRQRGLPSGPFDFTVATC